MSSKMAPGNARRPRGPGIARRGAQEPPSGPQETPSSIQDASPFLLALLRLLLLLIRLLLLLFQPGERVGARRDRIRRLAKAAPAPPALNICRKRELLSRRGFGAGTPLRRHRRETSLDVADDVPAARAGAAATARAEEPHERMLICGGDVLAQLLGERVALTRVGFSIGFISRNPGATTPRGRRGASATHRGGACTGRAGLGPGRLGGVLLGRGRRGRLHHCGSRVSCPRGGYDPSGILSLVRCARLELAASCCRTRASPSP
eukprot:8262075-Pyramimonas_sp.AAC.1